MIVVFAAETIEGPFLRVREIEQNEAVRAFLDRQEEVARPERTRIYEWKASVHDDVHEAKTALAIDYGRRWTRIAERHLGEIAA